MFSEALTTSPSPGPIRSAQQSLRAVLTYFAAAAALGVLADVGLRLGEQTVFLFVVATPWVVVAFGAGRASTFRWSAGAGATALLTGLVAYYLWLWLGQGVSLGILTGSGFNGMTWILVGAAVGAFAGLVGGVSRQGSTLAAAAAWCGIAAVPAVDAILQLAYGEAATAAVVSVFGATALALLAWGWRSGAKIWMLAVGSPVATLALWQIELAVLQQVFGRLTWI